VIRLQKGEIDRREDENRKQTICTDERYVLQKTPGMIGMRKEQGTMNNESMLLNPPIY